MASGPIRFKNNPLISPEMLQPSIPGFEIIGTFNAGATRVGDEVILLVRVAERPVQENEEELRFPLLDWEQEGPPKVAVRTIRRDDPRYDTSDVRVIPHPEGTFLTSISHLRFARSSDGRNFTVDESPAVFPQEWYEEYGVEDPRITRIGEDYYINYSAINRHGVTTALLRSKDMRTFERLGIIFHPDNKDIAIFPRKINGRYVTFHRPETGFGGNPEMWLAFSDNLRDWGDHRFLIAPRPGKWDDGRIGCGSVPIRTEKGWLEIYHGASKDNRYCLGLLLLDLEDPRRVLARSEVPWFEPETDYETGGFFGSVIFSCGAVAFEDGRFFLYYGGSDTVIGGAEATVADALASLQ